jgi:hypothetical protein
MGEAHHVLDVITEQRCTMMSTCSAQSDAPVLASPLGCVADARSAFWLLSRARDSGVRNEMPNAALGDRCCGVPRPRRLRVDLLGVARLELLKKSLPDEREKRGGWRDTACCVRRGGSWRDEAELAQVADSPFYFCGSCA